MSKANAIGNAKMTYNHHVVPDHTEIISCRYLLNLGLEGRYVLRPKQVNSGRVEVEKPHGQHPTGGSIASVSRKL